ncbi:polycomb protein EED-like [Rhizophagus irregularis DAOM 181602=DAOM 197198]|nr:polycomb protein EED-like [Rhizophagus irregularis DAOM 181602=DAOM 197198]
MRCSIRSEVSKFSQVSLRQEIHEMKSYPRDPYLLFLASKDQSIRLWNVDIMQTVAIFAGECGHREAPLSIVTFSLSLK